MNDGPDREQGKAAAPGRRPDPVIRWVGRLVWVLAIAAVVYSAWRFTHDRPHSALGRGSTATLA